MNRKQEHRTLKKSGTHKPFNNKDELPCKFGNLMRQLVSNYPIHIGA